jgi:hypothetical protein
MAEGETVMAAFDGGPRQFEQILIKALRSKGNPLTLARCAEQLKLRAVEQRARELVAEESVVTDIDRGRALWDLLRVAINRLRPSRVSRPKRWRLNWVSVRVPSIGSAGLP